MPGTSRKQTESDQDKYWDLYNMLISGMGEEDFHQNFQTTPKKTNAKRQPKRTLKIGKKELRTRFLPSRRRTNPDAKILPGREELFLRSIKIEDLACSICMELLMMPFSLRCGHTFCFYCLDSLSKHPSVCDICPCCRCYIGQEYPSRNRILESILPHLISKLSEEELNNYLGRKKKMLIQFEKRAEEYRGLCVNEKIDFKVGNHWEVGRVMKIYQKDSKTKIEVQARHSPTVFVFNNSSTHLASYRSFSQEHIQDITDFLIMDMEPQPLPIFSPSVSDGPEEFQSFALNSVELQL